MNWYSIFYWVSVADGVKGFFDTSSNIFLTFSLLTGIVYAIMIGVKASGERDERESSFWIKRFGNFFWISVLICLITWSGYVFIPSKREALTIIAGGAVGNFITTDSSARQLPANVMTLLNDEIKSEIEDIKHSNVVDTLENKSKEELIEMLKTKQ